MSSERVAARPRVVIGGLVLVIGVVLLGVAWAGGNPPAASPDENAHMVKAYATARLDLNGEPYPTELPGMSDLSADWFRAVGRSYLLPAEVVPPDDVRCFAFDPDLTADCQVLSPPEGDASGEVLAPTHFGTYSPALYFPLGLAMQGADDYRAAEWRGRLAALALSGAFIGWAVLLAVHRGRGWLMLAGVALATTPAVVFLVASVTTSGIEIAAAICLWTALLRIGGAPGDRAGGPFAAAAVSGAVMALSRPADAVLIAIIAAVLLIYVGRTEAGQLVAGARAKVAAVVAVLVVTAAASALWSLLVTPHPPIDLGLALRSLGDAVSDGPNQLRQIVGVFGWNDTPMPQPVYILSLGLLAAVVLLALRIGGRRDRIAMVALGVATLVVHIALAVLVEAQIGFGMQARYVLPLVVGLPLLATDVLEERRAALDDRVARFLPPVVFSVTAVVQLIAFLTNLHRYTVGASGSWALPWGGTWAPDGGFFPWVALALVGAALIAGVGVVALTGRSTVDSDPKGALTG